jgi:ectoine hydroxylase-related dioxygenase (phytanoyl-CoA dioxygenase family)
LPWHQDKTIAVKDNRRPSKVFLHPTTKAQVPHLEAPPSVLQHMLTLRLHLDDVDEENGPLRVITGSHRPSSEQQNDPNLGEMRTICVRRGDVLAIRPLVSHSSSSSKPGTKRHRRILHFEFSGQPRLPEGFCWHMFVPPEGMPG